MKMEITENFNISGCGDIKPHCDRSSVQILSEGQDLFDKKPQKQPEKLDNLIVVLGAELLALEAESLSEELHRKSYKSDHSETMAKEIMNNMDDDNNMNCSHFYAEMDPDHTIDFGAFGHCVNVVGDGFGVALKSIEDKTEKSSNNEESDLVKGKLKETKVPRKPAVKVTPFAHNPYKEAISLEQEYNELQPILNSLTQQIKQSEDRTVYHVRTLKMNILKSEQELQKVYEVFYRSKNRVKFLEFQLMANDLEWAMSEMIHRRTMERQALVLAKIRSKIREMGKVLNELYENTKTLADLVFPLYQADTKRFGIGWLFNIFSSNKSKDFAKDYSSQSFCIDASNSQFELCQQLSPIQ